MHDTAPRPERKSVLLIDDDKILRRLMTIILEKEGYEVAVSGDGAEAVRVLETRSFDLLIVDLMMPVMDGLRFLRWLRNDARSTVPALILTSVDDEGICQDVIDAGATGLLEKPIQKEGVLAQVRSALANTTPAPEP